MNINMNIYGYIYKITIINKKSKLYNHFYIGKKKGLPENSLTYYGSGIIINDYCHKHGGHCSKNINAKVAKDIGLIKDILDIAYSEEDLNLLEQYYIKVYQNSKYLLNLTSGGDGHSGIPWNKGLTKDIDDRIKKYSEKISGKNSHFYKKEPWNKGYNYSKDEKQKISDGTKEAMKNLSLDKKAKMRSKPGHKASPHSQKTKDKISKTLSNKSYRSIDNVRIYSEDEPYIYNSVKCLNDNLRFENIIKASKYYNISVKQIIKSALNNKHVFKNNIYYYFIFENEEI